MIKTLKQLEKLLASGKKIDLEVKAEVELLLVKLQKKLHQLEPGTELKIHPNDEIDIESDEDVINKLKSRLDSGIQDFNLKHPELTKLLDSLSRALSRLGI